MAPAPTLGRSTNAARSLGYASSSSSKPLIYPTGATKVEHLSTPFQELVVARHSICLAGRDDEDHDPNANQDGATTPDPHSGACNCRGLKPPANKVVLKKLGDQLPQDEDENEEDEEERLKEDESANGRDWKTCACGHDVSEHGRIAEEGNEERRRRIKVAIRLDELLMDKDRLLDFEFEDEDIVSLRKQIAPLGSAPVSSTPLNASNPLKRKFDSPGSQLTSPEPDQSPERSRDLDEPLAKHRKLDSSATSSKAKESTDQASGQGHGKKPAHSQKTVGGQAGEAAETKADEEDDALGPDGSRPSKKPATGINEASSTITSEQAAAGMSVDPTLESGLPPLGSRSNAPPAGTTEGAAPRRERPAITEERAGVIRFRAVENDGSPESMILLTGLKNIFQRQLPKMPREYITRLVLDRNHQSLAIVKRGLQVVGGITYRPFNHRKFAEIVFCAISSTEQVKGYGSHLMNHLKDHVKASSPVMHFLTYADNYAIGYFKKQGFTKEINLDRSVWVGYIKDYEGGTLMQCTMIPRVEYLKVHDLIASQKEMVLSKIRMISRSHVVHPGLEIFKNKEEGQEIKVDPSQVPGLKESGWTPEMDEISRRPKRGPHHNLMRLILVELGNHNSSWPFTQPVNANEVHDYYDVIKSPMDLSTMESKLENNSYATVDNLLADAQLIFDNCRQYNPPTSSYFKSANRLEKFLRDELPGWKASAAI